MNGPHYEREEVGFRVERNINKTCIREKQIIAVKSIPTHNRISTTESVENSKIFQRVLQQNILEGQLTYENLLYFNSEQDTGNQSYDMMDTLGLYSNG